MNIILLEASDRAGGERFVLRGRRAAHVREVLKAEIGETIRVGLLDGPLGEGRVVRSDEASIELECRFEAEAPARPKVDLICGVPRPKTLIKLLPEVTALGVDRLVLLRTWRVEKVYLEAQILEAERRQPLLFEGLMQARSTRLPEVAVERLFRPFIEDRAPEFVRDAAVRLIAHPIAERHLAEIEIDSEARVVIAIGPEGGFIPFEIDAFSRLNFIPVRIGPRPLRVETACVAALAQIELLRQQRRGRG